MMTKHDHLKEPIDTMLNKCDHPKYEIENEVTKIVTKANHDDAVMSGGCTGAIIIGFLCVGIIPLSIIYLGHGGWAALVSIIPAGALGSGIGGAIGALIGSRD